MNYTQYYMNATGMISLLQATNSATGGMFSIFFITSLFIISLITSSRNSSFSSALILSSLISLIATVLFVLLNLITPYAVTIFIVLLIVGISLAFRETG